MNARSTFALRHFERQRMEAAGIKPVPFCAGREVVTHGLESDPVDGGGNTPTCRGSCNQTQPGTPLETAPRLEV
jgi:hypothetical protein